MVGSLPDVKFLWVTILQEVKFLIFINFCMGLATVQRYCTACDNHCTYLVPGTV